MSIVEEQQIRENLSCHNRGNSSSLWKSVTVRLKENRKMRIHDRVWLSDENYLQKMVKSVLQVGGELGNLIRFALYSGLRGEEMTYVHKTAICNKLSSCGCDKLHITEKENGLSLIVINRVVGQKHSFFTIIPIGLWMDFRSLPKVEYEQRKVAHALLKSHTDGQVAFKKRDFLLGQMRKSVPRD
jgi:hypothetical protein